MSKYLMLQLAVHIGEETLVFVCENLNQVFSLHVRIVLLQMRKRNNLVDTVNNIARAYENVLNKGS